MSTNAILVLEDGSLFKGTSIGIDGHTVGEVVFNTAMTGYQEILTDPSYAGQMVTLTYPHIGNVGTNNNDNEATKIAARALIIRDTPLVASNFRSTKSLSNFLTEQNIIGIANIDTRRLTRILRTKGVQKGCLLANKKAYSLENIEKAQQLAQEFSGLNGIDLVKTVTTDRVYHWTQSVWSFKSGFQKQKNSLYHVVVYDFGVKQTLLRLLVQRGCRLTIVPATTKAEEVLSLSPDGVFLSNGPGDPQPCSYAIDAIRILLEKKIPLLGICLGHQLLALASGAQTIKMKFGHHGANHPVQSLDTKQVMITSQNHSFCVDKKTLPNCLEITHLSLFDGSLQGMRHIDRPAMSVQGHPEASPGPQDMVSLFDQFVTLMITTKEGAY